VAEKVRALPSARERTTDGVTIPYPGRLTDEVGQPVADGEYSFAFALYGSQSGGEPLWSEVQEGVEVSDGLFVTTLGGASPMPASVLNGGERWLAVGVRGPGEPEFTALGPRHQLGTASPAAPASPANGAACPHDHFGETWAGASADYGLRLENSGSDSVGLYAEGERKGVNGESVDGVGVHAVSLNSDALVAASSGGAGVVASGKPALVIKEGGIQVEGAGKGTDTPAFIHQFDVSQNRCRKGTFVQNYSTVVDHPLTNGNQDALLFITPNYGLASSQHAGPANAAYGVYYDDRDQCGFGADKWVIYAYDGTSLNNGQMFNVLVVVP
jgi:hypothetical protein